MLTLGSTPKPFVPRNPSYLYADVKLGAIGDKKDVLYEQDGAKFVRKVVEKDVVLGGDLAWAVSPGVFVGYKGAILNAFKDGVTGRTVISKPNGTLVKSLPHTTITGPDEGYLYTANLYSLGLTISNTDTGFGETYTPSTSETKAYFHGYRMNNGTFGTHYDGTGTKTWVPIGDTSNARAVTVVPTSASPTQVDGTIQPYKLSYVLATPQVVNVTDKVEGSLKANGLTQVEVLSGVVRREKVNPKYEGGYYYISSQDRSSYWNSAKVKYSTNRFLAVYKNGLRDNAWFSTPGHMGILSANFDPTAGYTVTYIALDKPTLTANPTNVKLFYAMNIRSSLEDVVGDVQDGLARLSVHDKSIVDIYIRLKALEG
jgi:hypothetical protein